MDYQQQLQQYLAQNAIPQTPYGVQPLVQPMAPPAAPAPVQAAANPANLLGQAQNYIQQAVKQELNNVLAPYIAQYQQMIPQQPQAQQVAQNTQYKPEDKMLLGLFDEFLKAEEDSGKALVSGLGRFSRFVQSKVDKPA